MDNKKNTEKTSKDKEKNDQSKTEAKPDTASKHTDSKSSAQKTPRTQHTSATVSPGAKAPATDAAQSQDWFKTAIFASLIIACLSGGLTSYVLWKLNHQSAQSDSAYLSLLQQLKQINVNHQKKSDTIESVNREITALQTSNQSLQQQLKAQQNTLSHALTKNQDAGDNWTLERSLYLMQLAQLSLQWNRNLSESITLLDGAKKLLGQVDDPSLLTVRQSLANELTTLKAIEPVDKIELLTTLQALSAQIKSLPSKLQTYPVNAHQDIATNTQKGWRGTLEKSWQTLQQLLIIRHNNQSIKPLLSPEQRKAINELIHLSLQQAQWAIIHDNNKVYQFSLAQAAEQIKTHFNAEQRPAAALLQQIAALQNKNIDLELPDISQSQQQLKSYLKQKKHNEPTQTAFEEVL